MNPELSDIELDTMLTEAHNDLLALAVRTADPLDALVAIMEHDVVDADPIDIPPMPTADCPARQRLAAVVEIRYRAAELHGELERVITRARDMAIDIERVLDDRADALVITRALADWRDQALDDLLGRARDLALAIMQDLQRTLLLDRELTADHDRAIRRELSIDVNGTTMLDRLRELDRALNHSRELSIEREIGAARELTADLKRARRLGREKETDRELSRGRARQLAIAIDVGLVRARQLAGNAMRLINAFQVDASGADLSGVRVSDPEILVGVIWTDETTWPADVADRIRILSQELSEGIYQVRGGGQRYDTELVVPV